MNARIILPGILLLLYSTTAVQAQKNFVTPGSLEWVDVAEGWASNSVNAAVFRKNSLTSRGDTQFVAFYNKDAYVVVGKRRIGGKEWQLQQTPFKGNARDAHNIISIMADGEGFVHLAWDHHNGPLKYTRSITPGSLQFLEPMSMTGIAETKLSYPEFYRLANGDLLFFYRDGGSGQGNMVINKYSVREKKWVMLHRNLIDGEGKRNAYWQACVDGKGGIHISWVWRESPDVASNHDLCYAVSRDGGISWESSSGNQYQLPITAANAEYACKIPQGSELINQTSMTTDEKGNPFIATYWRDSGTVVPQYHLVYRFNNKWCINDLAFRKTAFSLSGGGTKRIPISRPQVICWGSGKDLSVAVWFRDEERNNRVSMALNKAVNKGKQWVLTDLSSAAVGSWEPTYDINLWLEKKQFHAFVQYVEQADGEGATNTPPQMVQVLQWQPLKK
ncbi:BNR repeat-containing protein [Filimonas effusa]|uniref:Neuraminidase n=1 Tax=Filimonas effusa TaxID=2508721 RepID=A0A4Q1DE40_9BACT|nr:BNR repeat-containing protein [Filimonas effusa]RXK86859.1 neuraminidase [Filimonas effusa]